MEEQSKELVDTLRSVGLPRGAQMDLMRQAAARIEYLEREREAFSGELFALVRLIETPFDRQAKKDEALLEAAKRIRTLLTAQEASKP